jgi:protease-4
VISQFLTAEELLDKVGVKIVVITAGEVKDFGSVSRDVTDEELAYWQGVIDETYEGFVRVVAEGRGMDEATVRELADGRVYTGEQALELGLIDEIGYFDDAIAKAAELGGISGEPRVVELQPEQDFLSMLYGVGGQAHDQASLAAVLELLKMVAAPTLEFRYVSP